MQVSKGDADFTSYLLMSPRLQDSPHEMQKSHTRGSGSNGHCWHQRRLCKERLLTNNDNSRYIRPQLSSSLIPTTAQGTPAWDLSSPMLCPPPSVSR